MALAILSFFVLFALQEDTLDRARLLAEAGRLEDAIRFLEGRTRTDPSAAELAYLAQLQAGVGGLPQAAEALGRALALAPEQDALRVTRGAMLFELRRYEEAKNEIEVALARSPGVARAHYYLGAVHQGLGELGLAEKSAERAIALSGPPSNAPLGSLEPAPGVAARHLLAEVQFALGREPGQVETLLRDVLAFEPDHAQARYLLARSLQRLGREEDAKEELRRFDAIQRAESHVATGRGLANLGRGSEAIEELTLAIEAHPDHARALYLLGRELLRAGRKDDARPFLDRALALRPDASSEVNQLLASFP
jgi:tetratricopeptide (TPR) repeat protein